MSILRFIGDVMRLMVGIPSYDAYVAHQRAAHPDKPVMSYADFVRERQKARFGGGGSPRCC